MLLLGYTLSIIAALASIYWIRDTAVQDACPCGFDLDEAYPILAFVMERALRLDLDMREKSARYRKAYGIISTIVAVLASPFVAVLLLDMLCRDRQHRRKCLVYQVHR